MLRVSLIGNLGADPEVRFTQKGTQLVTFRVAVNQIRTGPDGERQESTEWFRVRAANRMVEFVQRLTKGTRVLVIGRLDIGRYQSRDGETRTSYDVWADEVQSMSGRSMAASPTDARTGGRRVRGRARRGLESERRPGGPLRRQRQRRACERPRRIRPAGERRPGSGGSPLLVQPRTRSVLAGNRSPDRRARRGPRHVLVAAIRQRHRAMALGGGRTTAFATMGRLQVRRAQRPAIATDAHGFVTVGHTQSVL